MNGNSAARQVTRIPLAGLRCRSCAERIASRLERVGGVSGASVSVIEGLAVVRHSSSVDPLALVRAVRAAGGDPAVVEVAIPIASIAGSLEQAGPVERELARLPGVVWAAVDLMAAEVRMAYEPGTADAERIRALLRAHGWQAAHPGAGSLAGPDPLQRSARRRAVWCAATALLAATAASMLALLAGSPAVAPLARSVPSLAEALRAHVALSAAGAHVLLALLAVGTAALAGRGWAEGALRDLQRGVVTSRLLASAAVIALLAGSIVGSIATMLGGSPPLFYSVALWVVAALALEAALAPRRGAPFVRPDEAGPEATLRRRMARALDRAIAFETPENLDRKRHSRSLALVLLVSGVAAAALWLAAGGLADWPVALLAFAAVVLAGAPAAPALHSRAVGTTALRRLAEAGIVVAGTDALRTAARTSTLAVTGRGGVLQARPAVSDLLLLDGVSAAELLEMAAGAAMKREHPISEAIALRLAREPGARGRSSEGVVVANRDAAKAAGLDLRRVAEEIDGFERDRKSVLVVAREGSVRGVIAFAHPPRAGSETVLRSLADRGKQTILLTGDADGTAAAVAGISGAERYAAGAGAEAKASLIGALRQESAAPVAYLSDRGDRRARARADLGLAFLERSSPDDPFDQVSILRDDCDAVGALFREAEAAEDARRLGRIAFAVYHALAIPIAAGALTPFVGLAPSPMLAAAASAAVMALASRGLPRARREGP
ncbi:MAG TPA: cation transporter [Thermoanaerobaculia bacterium]|nr:cation transporter [Thermoanaerobaculia bacterium]